jgi:D-alanine transaminase
MNKVKAVFNGKFDLVENIKISPFSRAYTFSDSVYEVIPFFKSKPIAFSMHLERLKYSSTELAMNIEIEKISSEINNLISSCESNSGYVYYQITRGVDNIRSHMYSNSLEIETFGYVIAHAFASKPLKVMVCEDIRWGRCNIKSTSLLGNVMSMNSAHKDNCDEVIMHKNNILREAGASNLFFIKDNKICTPALSNNILPGITRALLIIELKKIGLDVIEDEFLLSDISNASSAWLTSSTKGLAPIYEITNLKSDLNIDDPVFLKCKEVFEKKFFS